MAISIEEQAGSNQPEFTNMTPRKIYDSLVAEKIPLGRDQTPEDIGNLAVFLASEYSKNITGQAINVCGGTNMDLGFFSPLILIVWNATILIFPFRF